MQNTDIPRPRTLPARDLEGVRGILAALFVAAGFWAIIILVGRAFWPS